MKLSGLLRKYTRDQDGGFALFFAIGLTMILVLVGAAYEYSGINSAQVKLQNSLDTAALAGASTIRSNKKRAKKTAKKILKENIALIDDISLKGKPKVSINNKTQEITVSAKVNYQTVFGGILGMNEVVIKARSTSGFAIETMNPFSVFLVLDVSGSMSWLSSDGKVKIESLKKAVDDMYYTLYSTSENPSLLTSTIRTGFSSYNTALGDVVAMNTGYSATTNDVNKLVAAGGTNSTPGFQYAYDQIKAEMAAENKLAAYLVFMTDGDNNNAAWDVSTIALCDQAKLDKITIFTVAFEAPAKGKALLRTCATDPSKAYKSSNSASLNMAFRDTGREISQSVVRIKR